MPNWNNAVTIGAYPAAAGFIKRERSPHRDLRNTAGLLGAVFDLCKLESP